jgi:hypothetical protein
MNTTLILLFCLITPRALVLQQGRTKEVVVDVPTSVASRVTTVLDAMVRYRKAEANASSFSEWEKVERPIARLIEDKTSTADEALVVLT